MRSGLVALLAASVLVLGACGADGDDGADETGTASGETSSSPGGEESGSPSASASEGSGGTVQYVALGDSYTSAPLVPETDPADPCLRSSNNYPALLARAMPDLALVDVSCAGADSTALVGAQTIGSSLVAPQFAALSDDTDLVTVGMGGNDFGLFSTLLADCASSSDVDAAGQPCTDAALDGTKQDLTAVLPQVQERLGAVLTGVVDRAPSAQVLVVNYPRLVPDSGTCAQLGVAAGDVDYVRSLDDGLSEAVAKAAADAGLPLVDIHAASEGHDICSADPWVNGNQTIPDRALAYHPFAVEQQAVADLLVAQLQGS